MTEIDSILSDLPENPTATETLSVAVVDTPLEAMLLASTPNGLCLAEFTTRETLEQQLLGLQRLMNGAFVQASTPHIQHAHAELTRYFAGQLDRFSVPLIYPGSAFQRSVWTLLLTIPYGQTRSYESLALELGQPTATRAVGTANGQNRLAIFIPCHRVVNKSGRLGGYAGGLWRKQILLDLEQGQRTLA